MKERNNERIDESDPLRAHWPAFRSRVQERWSRLTDDWLGDVDGHRGRLAEKLRDAYGVSETEAHRQVDDFVETHWNAMSTGHLAPDTPVKNSPGARSSESSSHSPGPTSIGKRNSDSGVGTGTVSPGGRDL